MFAVFTQNLGETDTFGVTKSSFNTLPRPIKRWLLEA